MARRSWTVQDIADRTGLKRETLYRRFRGDDGRLTIPELELICRAFDIPMSTLLARAEAAA